VGREWVRSEEEIHGADTEWPRSGEGVVEEWWRSGGGVVEEQLRSVKEGVRF
jgi:hypothetical protein